MKGVFIDAIVFFKFRLPPHPLSFSALSFHKLSYKRTLEIRIKLAITSRSDYSRCRMRSGIYSHVIDTKNIVYKIGI